MFWKYWVIQGRISCVNQIDISKLFNLDASLVREEKLLGEIMW